LFRHRALTARLLVRFVFVTAIVTAMLTVPLVQTASAKLSQKAILLEANDALPGFHKVVPLDIGAEMVGFTWLGNTVAEMDVRGQINGVWTPWLSIDGAPDEGPDHASPGHSTQVSAGPAWLGHNASAIEMRVTSGKTRHLMMHAIDTEPAKTSSTVKPAGADTPMPFIKTRADWGADESLRTAAPSYASSVDFAVVHHTVNSNSYNPTDSPALIRGIYLFHVQANGWSDIGYNFLIDRFGQIFEGRYGGINQPVIGGHAGGFNANSTGVALIGDFTSTPVPAPMYQSLRQFLAWKLALHHIDPLGTVNHTVATSDCNCTNWPPGTTVTIPTLVGHRDLDQTGCPGQFMYDLLPQLRNDVSMDIGSQGPAQWICQWDAPTDYGPGATSPSSGRDDVFVRGDDGQLWQGLHSGGVASWWPLGGVLTSDPDATTRPGGGIDVVARGADNALWIKSWNGALWTPWTSLGGYLASGPTVVSSGLNRVDVFACGRDGAIWTQTFNGTSWSGWGSLGGRVFSSPDAASDAPGDIDIFVRSVGGEMYERSLRAGAWGNWTALGGVMASGPGAASWGPNRSDVVTRGTDGAVWANASDGAGFYGWYSLGGIVTSDPDVTAPSLNHLVVTARGVDNRYWQRTWNGQVWSGWTAL
jgi:N-acetylmuramoyl-L-alanine amidase